MKSLLEQLLEYRWEYDTSEKAFLDIWEKYNKPKELIGEQCYEFLEDLFEITKGWFIVDHFSFVNFDHLTRIEVKGSFVYLFWKDFTQKPPVDKEEFKIFDECTYIFSLLHIQKLRFELEDSHLSIAIMPYVKTHKEVKKELEIERMKSNQLLVEDVMDDFYSEYLFVRDGKRYRCFSHNLPFYSLVLQPKEKKHCKEFSKMLLLELSLEEQHQKIEDINDRLSSIGQYDIEEILSCGNSLRRLLEQILKYYSIYSGYELPSSYGYSLLGDLKKHLKNNNDKISKSIDSKLVKVANDLSHDTGKPIDIKDVIWLKDTVENIIKTLEEDMVKKI